MKFTKRAYANVNVWQNCPEDEREDTRTLKLKAETQPTFDLADINQ